MADQDTTDTSNTPIFRLQKLYVKDLSFENPNAPEVFFAKESEPKVDLNLGLKNKKLDDNHWEVTLAITAKISDTKTDKTLFISEIEHAAAFQIANVPEEHMATLLAVECPTVMFPYTRQILSQASVDGGFIPFLMEPVNFLAIYENSKKKAQTEKEKEN
jgi:preprotein translocase subunit SecB